MHTDLHAADSLSAFIGVDFISKVDGVPKLLERIDALLPPNPNERQSITSMPSHTRSKRYREMN
jgi:hypothetical protein